MQLQTVFKTGNSYVISIPKRIIEELRIKNGQQVAVGRYADTDQIMIDTKPKKSPVKGINKEFKRWIDTFLKEDGALLDELANR